MKFYISENKPEKDEKYLLRLKRLKGGTVNVTDTFDWLLVRGGRCLFDRDGESFFFNGSEDMPENYESLLSASSKKRALFKKIRIKLTEWEMTCRDFSASLYLLETGENHIYIMKTGTQDQDFIFHYCMEEIPSFGFGVHRAAAGCGDSLLGYTTRAECPSAGNPVLRDSMSSVHQHLLSLIRLNADGVLKGYDTEFLHDYRVSVRRLRSALSLVKNVYTKQVEDDFRVKFRSLGELTGRARDMDVYLDEIDCYFEILPESMRDSLKPIKEYFEKIRDAEYRSLRRYIRSEEYEKLLSEWDRVTGTYSETGRRGFSSTKRTAKAVIKKAYENAVMLSEALDSTTADSQIHSVRIAFKKLRYCIEFFCRYLGAEKTADVLTELRNLQDSLGRFNDFSVQCVNMTAFMGRAADQQTSAACGYILSYLSQSKEKEREKAVLLIKDFCKRKKRIKNVLGI